MTAVGQVDSVRNVFVKLRTRSGLTVERLAKTDVNVEPLTNLEVVSRAQGHDESHLAIVEVVTSLAGKLLPTDLLIVDAALALGIVKDRVGDSLELRSLYADDVGDRRAALVAGWGRLHAMLGITDVPLVPSITSLRTVRELESLERLAKICVEASSAEDSGRIAPGDEGAIGPEDTIGSVAIVGGAVMDLIFVVDDFPAPGTSTQGAFERHAGGKGLNLAVAARRMGMMANLITAIGDDADAATIHAYLEARGLSTEFVRKKRGAETPVTGVIVTKAGEASYLGWRNETQVALSNAEMDSLRFRHALDQADAVLVTFEPAIDIVRWALDTATTHAVRPLVILQPSPPLESPQQLYGQLRNVDYLVGREWELRRLLPDAGAGQDSDLVARRLLNLGVGAVCVVEQFGCKLWAKWLTASIVGQGAELEDSPGSREAFSAALVRRLLLNAGRTPSRNDLKWSVTAMSCNLELGRIASSMPSPEDVDRRFEPDESSE